MGEDVAFLAGVLLGIVSLKLFALIRDRLSRYLVKHGKVPLPCQSCGRALNVENLTVLERMVLLAERTEHYVDVSFRPDAGADRWRVISKATSKGVDLFTGSALEVVLSEAEWAAQRGGALVDETPTLRLVKGGRELS